jgi:5'-nucleotidase
MSWVKPFFRIFFAFSLFFSFFIAGCSSSNHSVNFTIMATADIQSNIVPYEAKIDDEDISVGGFERIAAAARTMRNEADASLLVSTGDDLFGPLFSLLKGEPEITGMNLAGYDIVCPGNHEFDFGADLYKTAIASAGFPIVCANLNFDDQELSSIITSTHIKKIKGVKVGIFGLMTPDFLRVCNPGPGIEVSEDYISVAQNMVNELESVNCDLIIALTHIGEDDDRILAQNVEGIDIIVGGHSHTYVYETVNNTIIINDGAGAQYLGILRFTYEDGQIKSPDWELVLLDSSVGTNYEIQTLMAQYMSTYEEGLGEVIGRSTVDLDATKSTVRGEESVLGNMIADAMLYWFDDADIALINGGTIRGDKIYPAGDLTYLTVNEILPFRNEIVKVQLPGTELRQVLEISASSITVEGDDCSDPNATRTPSGGFLQIGGLKVTYDTSREPFCAVYDGKDVTEIVNPGNCVTNVEFLENGDWNTLEDDATYTILISSWLAGGGDGYYFFRNESVTKDYTTVIDADVLIRYIQENTPLTPILEGRITIVSQ